jgi:hypothetical protein
MRTKWIAALFVAACVEGGGSMGPEEIRLWTGGGFDGNFVTTLRPDDTVATTFGGGLFDGADRPRDERLPAGTYAQVRALLERKLPALAARVGDEPCEPHADGRGIWVVPAIRGIDGVQECSAGPVADLIHEVEGLYFFPSPPG